MFVDHQRKTVISMNLQLYNKGMQLKLKNEVNKNFVFRLGELHICLPQIEKYVEHSGQNSAFWETIIYGPTTLDQIIKGKHMKRTIEAYMNLYLALSKRYTKIFIGACTYVSRIVFSCS